MDREIYERRKRIVLPMHWSGGTWNGQHLSFNGSTKSPSMVSEGYWSKSHLGGSVSRVMITDARWLFVWKGFVDIVAVIPLGKDNGVSKIVQ